MIDLEYIAKGLSPKARKYKDGWITCCPAHDDNNPSLAITPGDSEVFTVHCFAGCDWKAIKESIKAVGLYKWEPTADSTENWKRGKRKDDFLAAFKQARAEQDSEEPKPQPNHSSVYTAQAIRAMDVKIPPIIIGPIRGQTENWLIGPPGAGKTFFAHAIAAHASAGVSMGCWPVIKHHKVAVIDGEMPLWGLKSTLETLKGAVQDYLIIPSAVMDDPLNLFSEQTQQWLTEMLQENKVELAILDNLVNLFRTDPEKPAASAEYATAVSHFLVKLRNKNIATLTFDHPGKDGTTAFGSSRQHITSDYVGKMLRGSEHGTDDQYAGFRLVTSKTRGGFNPAIHGTSNWELQGGFWGNV